MKLALPLLLAALALCCPDAQAGEVCPALSSVISSFLLEPKGMYNEKISQFGAPIEAMQDSLRVKTCVDQLPANDRLAVAHFVEIVKFECKKQLS